jgi:carbon-monoxide dehydrogenase medium subunit
MKPARFDYRVAKDRDDALRLARAGGEGARFLAGGQSLVPMMNFRVAKPETLIDINRCADLAYVLAAGGELRIGAMTRQRRAEADPLIRHHAPLIAQALELSGPLSVRNRGTIGGIFANCYPWADLLCVGFCLDARVIAAGPGGERTIPVAEFMLGAFASALEPGELVVEIRVAADGEACRSSYRKYGDHRAGAAIVSAAAWTDGRVAKIAVGGLGSVPARLTATADAVAAGAVRNDIEAALATDLTVLESEVRDLPEPDAKLHMARVLVHRVIDDIAGRQV